MAQTERKTGGKPKFEETQRGQRIVDTESNDNRPDDAVESLTEYQYADWVLAIQGGREQEIIQDLIRNADAWKIEENPTLKGATFYYDPTELTQYKGDALVTAVIDEDELQALHHVDDDNFFTNKAEPFNGADSSTYMITLSAQEAVQYGAALAAQSNGLNS